MPNKPYEISFRPMTSEEQRQLANGLRNTSRQPLTDSEIEYVKSEIKRIQADESVFVFNDPNRPHDGTCYNYEYDKIYVTKDVFPDQNYASAHPRAIMSVAAVLAHKYYGHRFYREEYLKDKAAGNNYHTTPLWEDECRASLRAAQMAPGLTPMERKDLVLDAVFRAQEYGQLIPMSDFMMEVVYGYSKDERQFSKPFVLPKYVSMESQERALRDRSDDGKMPKVRRGSRAHKDRER